MHISNIACEIMQVDWAGDVAHVVVEQRIDSRVKSKLKSATYTIKTAQ
jgi:hypothetical protein